MTVTEIHCWFVREVLPLESSLTRFLRRHWRNGSEIADLRQEIYMRVCDSARTEVPRRVKPFLFVVARNLIIDLTRRSQLPPIRACAAEVYPEASDTMSPDHEAIARQDLEILQHAINRLPDRRREVVVLRRFEGLSQRETASRMGVTVHTVERQMVKAMQDLAGALAAESLLGDGKCPYRRT